MIIFFCTILLICLWNIISYQSYVDEYQHKYTEIAKKDLEEGLYIKAKKNLEKALSFNGQFNEEASLILAKIFLKEGMISKAISTIEEKFDVNYSKESYLFYASVLEENNELGKAVSLLESYPKEDNIEVKQALSSLLSKRSIISSKVTRIKYSTNLITAEYEEKWGYMNKKGQWIIDPIFERATPFIDELAIVVLDSKSYFINKNGQRISFLDKEVEDVLPFIDSRASIKIDEEWVFVDSEFNVLCEKKDYLGSFANGYAPFKKDDYWGVINARDKEILYGYQEVVTNALGQATVGKRFFAKTDDQYFLYDIKGKKIAGPFQRVKAFFDENKFAAVMNADYEWGFIDLDGKVRIDYAYEEANSFVNKLAAVREAGFWGFIDNNNSIVIACKYKKVTDFYNGVSLLQEDTSKLVLLDRYKDLLRIFD
ncbi:MAG: WG repeat-containing protein [Clostridia bacterium]